MHIELTPELARAGPRDWRLVADITAEAFRADPVMTWTLGNPRAIQSALRVFARSLYTRHGICHLFGNKGATMWMPFDVDAAPSTWEKLQFAMGLTLFGTRGSVNRAVQAMAVMAEHHPRDRHLYLFTIGLRPSAQGQGVGKRLLAPVLAACDRADMPVYLENSNPVNHGFYTALGFERIGEFFVGRDSPPMAPMWREPRSNAESLPLPQTAMGAEA